MRRLPAGLAKRRERSWLSLGWPKLFQHQTNRSLCGRRIEVAANNRVIGVATSFNPLKQLCCLMLARRIRLACRNEMGNVNVKEGLVDLEARDQRHAIMRLVI